MKKKLSKQFEKCRITSGPLASSAADGMNGAFLFRGPLGRKLSVIASDGGAWEHVSVSTRTKTPYWSEMCYIKNIFWDPEETVIQYHPKKSEYINNHPFCLHMWRPTEFEIPLPPKEFIGI